MKADFQTYARAARTSLLGLAIQFVLGTTLLVYSFYGRDYSAFTGAIFILVGVPVWLTLAIVFDQHRRERVEALEAESLSEAGGRAASVFEEAGEELRVAARRLSVMHKVLVPAVSVLVGAILVGAGILRFNLASGMVDPADFVAPTRRGWATSIGLGIAFIGFVFARYVAGMAKQPVWANLRAGAAYAVGAALIGLSMAVAHFIDIAGPDVVVRYLQLAFPVALIVLGAEVFLNFVLGIYRPRKPGETPRPAFESRILGFAAAPDRIAESIGGAINYQFGFDVTGSWFYQLLSRSLVVLVVAGLAVGWLLTSVVVIEPHQKALRLRSGKLVGGELGPGIHLKWPWPVESIVIPEYIERDEQGRVTFVTRTATGIRSLDLGTNPAEGEGPILWTNEHAVNERATLVVVQPAGALPDSVVESVRDTADEAKDLSLMAVEVPLHYAVGDVLAYELLGPPEMRDEYLRAMAQREVLQYLSVVSVSDLLGPQRAEISLALKRRIEEVFTEINPLGPEHGPVVDVLMVGVEGVHPPGTVAPEFEDVVVAEEKARQSRADREALAASERNRVVGSVELAEEITRELDELERLQDAGAEAEAITRQRVKVQQLVQSARGSAAQVLQEASAQRWRAHMGAREELARYQGVEGAYAASPPVFRVTRALEALREALADTRLFIVEEPGTLDIWADIQDRTGAIDVFENLEEMP